MNYDLILLQAVRRLGHARSKDLPIPEIGGAPARLRALYRLERQELIVRTWQRNYCLTDAGRDTIYWETGERDA